MIIIYNNYYLFFKIPIITYEMAKIIFLPLILIIGPIHSNIKTDNTTELALLNLNLLLSTFV